MPSRRCSWMPSKPAAPRCVIIARRMDRSAISSTISKSTTARGNLAPLAKAKSNGSCSLAARPSIAHRAKGRSGYAEPWGLMMRKLGLIVLALGVTLTGAAFAEYPDRPIRFIVPQAAGSATDTVARILAAELSKELGQQLFVEHGHCGAMAVRLGH